MAKHDSAYDQVAHPSAGGTLKQTDSCDDALGNPGRFTRTVPGHAVPDSKEELRETREKQLGSNGYQGN